MARCCGNQETKGDPGPPGEPGSPGAPGAPGAPGGSDAAFAAWIADPNSATNDAFQSQITQQVEDSLENWSPGVELAYSERTSTYTTTKTVPDGVSIPGLGVTVEGAGRPVDIVVEIPSAFHSVANTGMVFRLFTSAPSTIVLDSREEWSPVTNSGPSIRLARRLVLTDGVTYTFATDVYGRAAGTVSILGAATTITPSISVVSR